VHTVKLNDDRYLIKNYFLNGIVNISINITFKKPETRQAFYLVEKCLLWLCLSLTGSATKRLSGAYNALSSACG
jgi:hypothetical protein